ncbi:peptidoglycan bridge formation glycyltransferase FemA/FemB family protein [Floricoccus penangensis]|uniref:peptidoglycan bridge formation glycyltransferase FemA/FemB family protein n=1 Tax=Floricoccus penangensis TaxID=1859475 RepID=UPI00203D537F|nr:peptidoglycan bridge formation glycyltransferase FemA/FemB family protein [Floricoccus penangensis]URZ86794.1 aminoacyltransferase [Floricoccus penangensis]
MFTYKVGIKKDEHDSFVESSSLVCLLQSSTWGKVKNNWENELIGFYSNDKMVGTASVLIKKLPLNFSMIYIPRGPILDYSNRKLLKFVINSLKEYGKRKNALFIKIDPLILRSSFKLGDEQVINQESENIISDIKKFGGIWHGLTKEMSTTIQPRFQANVYTQADIESTFPKHTKRLMNDARKRGVYTERADITQIEEFSNVVALTETRKNISLRNKEYFKNLMEMYGDDAYLHLAKVNVPQKLKEYKKNLEEINKQLLETQDHQKKKLTKLEQQKNSTTKYIKELESLNIISDEDMVIAGILSIQFGDTMEMLYAGMDDRFKTFYPQYLLNPKVFSDAYDNGIRWSNIGGIQGNLDDGLTKFKSNFNPTIEETIGEFDIPANKIFFSLSQLAYKLKKEKKLKFKKK